MSLIEAGQAPPDLMLMIAACGTRFSGEQADTAESDAWATAVFNSLVPRIYLETRVVDLMVSVALIATAPAT